MQKLSQLLSAFITLTLFTAVATLVTSCTSNPSFQDGELLLPLNESVELNFHIHDGFLLGMADARIDGRSTSNPATMLRPVIAQEWGDNKVIYPLFKLQKVVQENNRIELHGQLVGTDEEQGFQDHFVYAADFDKAQNMDLGDELNKLRTEANEARDALIEEGHRNTRIVNWENQINDYQQIIDNETDDFHKKRFEILRDQIIKRKEETLNRLVKNGLRNMEEYASHYALIDSFETAITQNINKYGKIHRDPYFFAHLQQPEQICEVGYMKRMVDKYKNGKHKGNFVWIFETHNENIAGWDWKGWKHNATIKLANNRKVNAVRFLETRELDGNSNNTTLVGMRYRGLGSIEQTVQHGDAGHAIEAWSTSDILPTLLNDVVAISPVIPPSVSINDRGYALKHRAGSWLIYPPRGAGSSIMDFQYKSNGALITYKERQGNHRALAEVYPGDKFISFTEEERFANTSGFTTTPIISLVCNTPRDYEPYFWRNRWKETEQFTRDLFADELDFQQAQILPAVGMNWDFWSPDRTFSCAIQNLDSLIEILADQGVKMILNHNSGWINGNTVKLGMDGADTSQFVGGGSCVVNDWMPLPQIQDNWLHMNKKMKEHQMAYFIWLTGFSQYYGQFYREVGDHPRHWALNKPLNNWKEDQIDWTLPNHNIHDEEFRNVFTSKIDYTHNNFGFQGIWADSYQLSWMSQLDWATGHGGSTQRAWWEQIAQWTRNGKAFMSESVSIPGMSCSIEVADWEEDYWAFQHVSKWLRNGEHRHYTQEQLDTLSFLLMANQGGLSFDILEWSYCDDYWTATDIVPDFTRYSSEYMAALPYMNRPYLLPENKGILYLPYNTDREAILFAYSDSNIPEGISCKYILEEKDTDRMKKFHTYKLNGDSMLDAFRITTPPLADNRREKAFQPYPYQWPE